MKTSLRLLLVEDSNDDALLVTRELEQAGYQLKFQVVDNSDAMLGALEKESWDVVLSDYRMPFFSGIEALALLKRRGLDLPFIIVSGKIDEETAVAAMKAGAHDFVMKGRLARLAPAIERELREASNRRALRKSEEELRQAQKVETIGQLAGGIAHDFNNVLTVINMHCDSRLEDLPAEDPSAYSFRQIREAGARAASMTRQLLAFTRKQVLEPKVVALNRCLKDIESMLSRLIGETIQISVRPQADLWNLKIDPGQLEQVILNLVVNARDAMPRGGRITLATRNLKLANLKDTPGAPAVDCVELEVSDTGCGIGAEIQSKIFDPFFTTKGPHHGTGLGLATVRGIVEQAGGCIRLESQVGKGSSFKIWFPRVDLPVEGAAASEPPSASKDVGASRTVLVMDDQVDLREALASAFKRRGYEVLTPATTEEALKSLENYGEQISLLVTDVIMPTMGGPELAKRFQAACPGIKTIYASGYIDTDIDSGLSINKNSKFLQKPFSISQLFRKVEELFAVE